MHFDVIYYPFRLLSLFEALGVDSPVDILHSNWTCTIFCISKFLAQDNDFSAF